MEKCCYPPSASSSWLDWAHATPLDPAILISNAKIGSAVGAFANSSNFLTSAAWAVSPAALVGLPSCEALETDNLLKVADAEQWNFSHKTAMLGASVPPPIQPIIFLRGGTQWQMRIPLDLGASTYSDIQLSFTDNLGTRGDSLGTVPVIQWSGSFTGAQSLVITVNNYGRFRLSLRLTAGAAISLFTLDWIIVP